MKDLIFIALLLPPVLSGCLPEVPDVPDQATCTADGWHVDFTTGEIVTDDVGAAIQCEFE